MTSLPEAVYSAAQVRGIERCAIRENVAEAVLMQRAGAAAWAALRQRWPDAKRIVVCAGSGNNAGDGYVLAQCAREAGCEVTVQTVMAPPHAPGAATEVRRAYLQHGGAEQVFSGSLPTDADVLVDALLGIGLNRALSGELRAAVDAINRAQLPVLALDVPSGLHADTGAVLGVAVRADVTHTFIALKPGLLTGAGPVYCGEILFDELGVPAICFSSLPVARRLGAGDAMLPRRARDAHKGAFGHVLVVGGGHGMGGAVRLVAEAALRSGAGLVSVATRAQHLPGLQAGLPEAMTYAVESVAELEPLLKRASIIAIGPGLGQDDWARDLLARVLGANLPLVLDADALNLLAHAPQQRSDWVLTPHPGEAARLLGSDTTTVQVDRFAAAAAILARYGGSVVLKGAGSLVVTEGELPAVCDRGNPGMAAPGTGDALTGVIAALMAQGLIAPAAARAGVWLHATAGDRAALRGERGLIARDLIAELRGLVNPA
ncbi:MAG TPA: NAD(P)H-hydrate dehydratase [Gammaproteobacteria bacterium]|nr:NAD(P)H-hydrate dehydratase [Gammaproteobacteria bacterium]